MLLQLATKGVRRLIVVAISFVSDHIETLYEIDILYTNLAKKHGIILKRARALNTEPLFIEALKDLVHDANKW
ncbi:Ferrochelatase [Candidatus Magnetobacterium bavaricum]|uniref:Ferrochelatase n=1 Tax=Candidatus Magnetobacterium bavaricum TaxID=29290 RepID=A0A0F3GWU6_9BACT|nr:Ferrochelatase [Candidatus Magnetobacterium bavaricum]